MKNIIRFVADVHLGNHKQFGGEQIAGLNQRCRNVVDALASSASACDGMVVLGDLFDTSSPSPQMVAAAIDALKVTSETHLLLGNHDMVSDAPGDHALAPLSRVSGLSVYEQPFLLRFPNLEVLMIPFRPAPMTEWFAEAVGDLLGRSLEFPPDHNRRAVCFHAGVRDHNTPKFLWGAPDAIDVDLLFDIMKRGNITTALCGNWHNPRSWRRDGMTVYQVGALVPTGFDNPGLEFGTAVDYDLLAGTWHPVKLEGPKFLKLTTAEFPDTFLRARFSSTRKLYLKVQLQPGETEDDVYAALLCQNVTPGELAGLVYAPASELTEHQEAEAAEAARTADSLDESLRQYVEAMPLPEGLDRAAVHNKVLTYMGRE